MKTPLREVLKYHVYVALRPLVPRLPRRLFYAVATLMGNINCRLHTVLREDVRRNYALIFGDTKTPSEINRIVFDHFEQRAKFVLETLLYVHANDSRMDHWFVLEGDWEELRTVTATGRGLVIPLPHFGPYCLAGVKMANYGAKLTDIAHDVAGSADMSKYAKRLDDERHELFRQSGGEVIELSHFLRGVIEAVKRGEAVAVFFDSRPTAQMTDGLFMGKRCQLHRGPVQIALKTGAAILLMTGYRDADNRIHVCYGGILEPIRTGNKEVDIRVNTQRIVDYHEQYLRRYPGQWIMVKEFDENLLLPTDENRAALAAVSGNPPRALAVGAL